MSTETAQEMQKGRRAVLSSQISFSGFWPMVRVDGARSSATWLRRDLEAADLLLKARDPSTSRPLRL
ncbi:MAG: hypothetical protein WBV97_11230, partial [Candidatus Sulfotelmatobacter sp.]